MKRTESSKVGGSTGRPINRTRIYYSIASGLLGVILFLTFCLFPSKVDAFELNNWGLVTAVSVCILIPYLYSGIWYLLDELEDSLTRIELDSGSKTNLDVVQLKNMLGRPWLYTSIIIVIMLSFLALDVLQAKERDVFFFSNYPAGPWNSWSFRLDVYILFSRYAMNFLLANLIWLVINMAWIFEKLASSYQHHISAHILDIDGFGGLGHLKNLILKTSLFYFSCLSLAVLSYASPSNWIVLVSYENILYLLMIIIGAGFFFKSLRSLKKILSAKVEREINVLNESYSRQVARLKDLSSLKGESPINDEMINISIALDALHKESERLIQIGGYGYLSLATIIADLTVSIATKILVSLLQ